MKNTLNRLFVVFLIVILTASVAIQTSAETIYNYNGFAYYHLSSTTASLCGWDNRAEDLVVPKDILEHYIVEISDSALENNSSITSVDFSKANLLERIGKYSFKNCSKISGSITLPYRVNNIGVSAFEGCSSLNSVNLKNTSLKSISAQVFYKCSSLTNVSLPNNLTEIDKLAFADCTSLKEIEIPKSVTDIDSTAFNGDSELTIQCYKDSYAEQFAKENNIEFELLDPILGDANFDGSVDVRDVTAIQKYKAGLTKLTKTGIRAADVTDDGEVSVRDATQVQRYLANIITDF